jgi:hypothetical protein
MLHAWSPVDRAKHPTNLPQWDYDHDHISMACQSVASSDVTINIRIILLLVRCPYRCTSSAWTSCKTNPLLLQQRIGRQPLRRSSPAVLYSSKQATITPATDHAFMSLSVPQAGQTRLGSTVALN